MTTSLCRANLNMQFIQELNCQERVWDFNHPVVVVIYQFIFGTAPWGLSAGLSVKKININ